MTPQKRWFLKRIFSYFSKSCTFRTPRLFQNIFVAILSLTKFSMFIRNNITREVLPMPIRFGLQTNAGDQWKWPPQCRGSRKPPGCFFDWRVEEVTRKNWPQVMNSHGFGVSIRMISRDNKFGPKWWTDTALEYQAGWPYFEYGGLSLRWVKLFQR